LFDPKGTLVTPPVEIRLDEKVIDFLDQCNINERKQFETAITIPLSKGGDTNIFGVFWYIPFEEDTEHRPTMLTIDDETSEECIIRCYWQNRLVPYSIVRNLPFFEEVYQRQRAEGVSPNWRRRMIGVLFLDWHFDGISINKLRISTSLEKLLCATPGVFYYPSSSSGSFLRLEPWLDIVTVYSLTLWISFNIGGL
jgi:hypothetical protein